MLLSNPYRPDMRVEREAKALEEEGHEVSILAWNREGVDKCREVIDGISVTRLGPRARYNEPRDAMVKLPIFWLKSLVESLKLSFDVIHAHDLDTLPVALFLSRLRSTKLVYDAHELYWAMIENSVSGWVRNLVERIERILVPSADIVITVTPKIAHVLEDYGAKRVDLIMNCGDIHEPSEKRVSEIRGRLLGEAEKIVLYVGMLEPSRNLVFLMKLFGKLDSKEVKLVVGGTGSLASQISGLAAELNNVDFIGWLPSDEVSEYVSASDLVVLIHDPRNTNIRLGISARLFNAMAAGKPVVVSEGTGNANITREEDIGVVVPFDEVDKVRNAILGLLRNERRVSKMAENGRVAAKERYNWQRMKRRLIRTYGNLGVD